MFIVTSFPEIFVTTACTPSPLSKISPEEIPVVSSTVNTVSPIDPNKVSFVVACVVPSPFTEVIVEPVITPVPLIGALNGG